MGPSARKRLTCSAAAIAFAAAVAAGAAKGSGGITIAGAPVVKPGVHQTANTSTDATSSSDVGSDASVGCWIDHELWQLLLAAGDRVVIRGSGYHMQLGVFPAGTTDRTIRKVATIKAGFPGERALTFTAARTAMYPIVAGPNCYDGNDGPLTFVVTIRHGAPRR